MTNAANQDRRSCVAAGLFLRHFIGPILFSIPNPAAAAGIAYPVSGVFAAFDPEFPNAAFEICMSVRTFGVEAVSRNSIAELIVFAKDKRHDLKGDVATETTIKTIRFADGKFHITETFNKSRGWIGIKRKTEYDMTVIDPNTIEIWDGKKIARHARCVVGGRLSS